MSRVAFILAHPQERAEAADLCRRAPAGTYVEFRESKRTDDQNRKLWPMLSEIAQQVEWPPGTGMKLSAEDWKLIALDGLGHEMRLVPNINQNGLIQLGRSSSKLTKAEFSDLIELLYMIGAKYGVQFRAPKPSKERETA